MAIVATSTLASCGESVLDSAGDRDRDRRDKGRAAATVRGVEAAEGKVATRAATKQKARRADPGDTEAADGKEQPDTPTVVDEPNAEERGPDRERPPEPVESCADDLARDLEGAGSMPSYVDLKRGCVRKDGDTVVLTATTVGGLPARMPDRNTNLNVGFELTTAAGETVYVGAEATDGGWSSYVSEGGASRDTGAPTIDGTRVVLTIPTSGLGDGRLSWNVESSWLRSTLTTTEYAFDDAPNGTSASYPAR